MDVLNMVGKPCPIPVIEAKKALRAAVPGEQIALLVDNDAARQNLQKMAVGMGCGFAYDTQEDGNVLVTITAAQGLGQSQGQGVPQAASGAGTVVAVGRAVMGGGDDELGGMLIKSYIHALTEVDAPPEAMLFYNGGVMLTTEGAATLEDLRVLSAKGVSIASCGACLNFYGLTEKLAIGEVTNMYTIAEMMGSAMRVVNL